jgi:hypothetical protein
MVEGLDRYSMARPESLSEPFTPQRELTSHQIAKALTDRC